jgi:5-methylcytosine-specific restriction endonuclease McrA
VEEWRIRTDPSFVRKKVFARDRGVCAICMVDTTIKYGIDWQADHIVPVVEGGGECGIDNYRTLCTPCHKAVTAELRRRLAESKCQSNPAPTDKQILLFEPRNFISPSYQPCPSPGHSPRCDGE